MVLEAWLQAHSVYSLQPGTWVKLAPQLYSVPHAGLLCLDTQSLQRLHRMLPPPVTQSLQRLHHKPSLPVWQV